MLRLRKFATVLRTALHILKNNDPLRLAAATAFFATFALPAILIILIQAFRLVVDPRTLSAHLFDHLALIVGRDSVEQIRGTLRGFRRLATNWYIAIGGFIFLTFVATTLFKVIRDSLNQLWNIKVYPHSGVRFSLLGRFKSIVVIMLAGLLFIISLLVEGVQALLLGYLAEIWAASASFLYIVLNQLISVIVVTVWFTVLFRFIGNGRPTWRVAIAGGVFTGVLFTIGKLVLGWALGYSNINNIYGASGSFVLVLLFVFYSSFILYLGGTFTYAWGEHVKNPITPGRNAYKYELREVKKQEGEIDE
jgi:membrane protein